MNIAFKSLTLGSIEASSEIQSWLSQFDRSKRPAAKYLLSRLQFASRDYYSAWLLEKLGGYADGQPHAVYSVRKFAKNTRTLWRSNGSVQPRPATTQGSEDLVASVISNALRQYKNRFLDHPSLKVLRDHEIHDIILIDDSIGSGKRISDFVRLMTDHPTFKSWWSYGLIVLHVLSLARTRQSQVSILHDLAGSDHGKRKHRVSDKIQFDSDIVYDAFDLYLRWGENSQAVLDLCNSTRAIARDRRQGFGNVMGNIVFYHSIPNNIPGMLYSSRNGWQPLFPDRALPDWCSQLLERHQRLQKSSTSDTPYKCDVTDDVLALLLNIRRGIRTKAGLSRRMDCGTGIANQMLANCMCAGLVTDKLRLTKAGHDAVRKTEKTQQREREPDRSLYVPTSWCIGQATVQPSVLGDR